jgi:hypothetical protein
LESVTESIVFWITSARVTSPAAFTTSDTTSLPWRFFVALELVAVAELDAGRGTSG